MNYSAALHLRLVLGFIKESSTVVNGFCGLIPEACSTAPRCEIKKGNGNEKER